MKNFNKLIFYAIYIYTLKIYLLKLKFIYSIKSNRAKLNRRDPGFRLYKINNRIKIIFFQKKNNLQWLSFKLIKISDFYKPLLYVDLKKILTNRNVFFILIFRF